MNVMYLTVAGIGRSQPSASLRLVLILIACLVGPVLGCAESPKPYTERYQLNQVTVVFTDEHTLQETYARMTGAPATRLQAEWGAATVRTVRGFYDFHTNTLYCSKMDFSTCGHELHHAAIGRFHRE
ncbi:MAG TPA: hypothetical protein VFA38_03000 [Nitrospirales bacterium]|nr:hypothetical protein [Nitrospirales bacterium]